MKRKNAAAIGIVSAIAALGIAIHAPDRMSLKQVFASMTPSKHPKDEYCKTPAAISLCNHVYELRTTKRPVYKSGEIATDYRRYIP